MKVLHWTELPGNKYSLKLHPAMLESYFFAEQTVRRVGVKRSEIPERLKIHYDRDYVFAKLLINVIEALKIKSLDELIVLMTEVWDETQHLNHEQFKAR